MRSNRDSSPIASPWHVCEKDASPRRCGQVRTSISFKAFFRRIRGGDPRPALEINIFFFKYRPRDTKQRIHVTYIFRLKEYKRITIGLNGGYVARQIHSMI